MKTIFLRTLNSRCNIYFVLDRSTSVLKYSMPVLKGYAELVEREVQRIFPNKSQLWYKSFSNSAHLVSHDNLTDLTQSNLGIAIAGSCIESSVNTLLRIMEILRRYDTSKCLVFLFTDCDDTDSESLDHNAYREKFRDDHGFVSVLFEYNRKSEKSNCQRVSRKLDHIGMIRVQVTQQDDKKRVMKGTIVPILRAFASRI